MERPSKLRWFINLWPPFLGSGIHVKRIDPDFRMIEVEMKLHFWNRNYVGTHYGGSLYSMTDPFYMLMLIENLGRDYLVWDKSASIRFRSPGKGTVVAHFELTAQQIESIRQQLQTQDKIEPMFTVQVRDEAGEMVAEVEKVVQIRRRGIPPSTPEGMGRRPAEMSQERKRKVS